MELPVQHTKSTSAEHGHCAPLIFMYWTGNSRNNLLSYCGLIDAKKGGSDKDLPVIAGQFHLLTATAIVGTLLAVS